MERSDFLASLREASKGVHGFLKPKGKKWLAAMIAGKKEGSDDEIDTDRIFELVCYFSLLERLTATVTDLQLIQGDGPNGYRFPHSPGTKGNFAFFRFRRGEATFDICCGTGLRDRDGGTVFPDISLQRGEWTERTDKSVGEVLAIWDGKFHEKGFSKEDLYQMNWWFDVLSMPGYEAGDILEQLFPESLSVSAVITNAPAVGLSEAQLIRKGFSVVFDFTGGGGCTAVPSRARHLGGPAAPPLPRVRFRRV